LRIILQLDVVKGGTEVVNFADSEKYGQPTRVGSGGFKKRRAAEFKI